jgi:hypothetical protein
MSIIDQASAESSRRYNADLIDPEASRWRRDTRAAFMDGVQWILGKLRDPDPETVDAMCMAFYNDPSGITDWTELVRIEPQLAYLYREHMRRAITALTNNLNGDPS